MSSWWVLVEVMIYFAAGDIFLTVGFRYGIFLFCHRSVFCTFADVTHDKKNCAFCYIQPDNMIISFKSQLKHFGL